MGVLSNKDIDSRYDDREQSHSHKKIPKYDKEYKDFRKKYPIVTSHKNMDPKSSRNDNRDEEDLER